VTEFRCKTTLEILLEFLVSKGLFLETFTIHGTGGLALDVTNLVERTRFLEICDFKDIIDNSVQLSELI
jgi:hypothetical protein